MKVYEILSKRSCSIWTHKQNKIKNEPTEKQTGRKNWEKAGAESKPKERLLENASKEMFECTLMYKLIYSIIENNLCLFILNLKNRKTKPEQQTKQAEKQVLP